MGCGASVGGALHEVWGQCWGSTSWGVGPVLREHFMGCGASVGGALHGVWGQCWGSTSLGELHTTYLEVHLFFPLS